MLNKPPKKIYENQEEAFEEFRKFITPYLKKIPEVEEAVVWASLAEGKFGTYAREHRGHTGSDVDLVVLLGKGKKIPKGFRDMECHKAWFDGHICKEFRHFDYLGNDHKVDVLLVKREELEKAKTRMKGRIKSLYLKKGMNREL
jgi:predicted nucleotidyltransferase